MPSVTPIFRANEFHDSFVLDWTTYFPWRRPRDVTRVSARYVFDEASIEIDLAGPKNVVSRCSTQFFPHGFNINEGVLLRDKVAGSVVHLIFPTPMRSVGAPVSTDGSLGQTYLAQCSVRLDDGQWHSVPPQRAALTAAVPGQPATAPMLGAIASLDRTIVEVQFDVVDPAKRVDFRQVAIGDLLFLPA